MQTIESFFYKKKKLPQKVKQVTPEVLNALNKVMLTVPKPKSSKRGTYKKITAADKLIIAAYASLHTTTQACKYYKFSEYDLKESSVRGWKNKYESAKVKLGRAPRSPKEAGLVGAKRGRKPKLGEKNMIEFVEYIKALRKSGADVNRYTTGACLRAFLVSTKQSYMLKENGGWIDELDVSLIREIWKKAGYSKRKKCRKRRGKLKKNAGFLAAQYKLRCKLEKRKYNIPDCLDLNFDETKLEIVPVSKYTMDEKGKKDIKGEKLDDKRCVTGFCGGARTGEAAKMQYICKGMSFSKECKDN